MTQPPFPQKSPPSSVTTESTDATRLREYVHAATSDNTRKAYRSAIIQFERWGGYLPTDAPTLLRYLLDKAETLNPRTLDLHLTAIAQWHRAQSLTNVVDDPQIKKAMEGIRRIHGRPKKKAKALRLEHIAQIVDYLSRQAPSLKHSRDLALILLAYFGAFRRSELVSIDVTDLRWEPEGLLVQISQSKTDQYGDGQVRALPFANGQICPAKAVKTWINEANLKTGPLFPSINRWGQRKDTGMNPGAVNDILKSLGKACNFDFALELSSHSFRRGLSTSAARENVSFELIKKQGGWKSDSVVWGYIEEGSQLESNATTPLLDKLQNLVTIPGQNTPRPTKK